MRRAVMLSIQPKWCELIASGHKTVEIRKTRPNLPMPFKCYIYMTKGFASYKTRGGMICNNNGGQVIIGEFICNKITGTAMWRLKGKTGRCAERTDLEKVMPQLACLSLEQIEQYAGGENRSIYAWHISNLVIYDKPLELCEFYRECPEFRVNIGACWDCLAAIGEEAECGFDGLLHLTRPPQSWCYVMEP